MDAEKEAAIRAAAAVWSDAQDLVRAYQAMNMPPDAEGRRRLAGNAAVAAVREREAYRALRALQEAE